jgi:ATP-binding cassette, subfamily B, bacterial MsbA
MKKFLGYFWPYLREYKLKWVFAFIGVLFTLAGTLGLAEIMKHLIDDVLIPKSEKMLYIVSFSFIVLYTIKGIGRYIQAYFVNFIGQDIIRRLRDKVLDHMLHLDMNFFQTSKSGELISRLSNDIARIQNIVAYLIPELVRDGLTVVGLIGYAIYLNYELAFYALVILPLTFYPLLLLAKKMKKISHASQEKNADVTVRLTEIFNNVEMIQANSTEHEEVDRFSKHNHEFFKINMKGVKVAEFINPMMEVFGAAGITAMLIVGGLYVIKGELTQGELIAFVTAIGMLSDPIKKIAGLLNRMQDGVAAAERVYSILDKDAEIKNGSMKNIPKIEEISFKDVSLYYDDIQALNAISLSAKKGQNIALIGDSGGGKSSLVNLILRFYDVSSGSVHFNDHDIKEFDLKSLRSHIAMVSQRVYIFADTLALNVAYGCDYDEARIIDALEKADATSFVAQLKDGIHTVMEEFGSNLSGGQRQRIAIARAIYKDADILILDEATSALDNKSEARIQAAFSELSRDKITFTIAHRLSTIESADKILVFKKGEIVDQGTHSELLDNSAEYQRLRGETH